MPIKKATPTAFEIETAQINKAIINYTKGKPHKQLVQRAFMAGYKFKKKQITED